MKYNRKNRNRVYIMQKNAFDKHTHNMQNTPTFMKAMKSISKLQVLHSSSIQKFKEKWYNSEGNHKVIKPPFDCPVCGVTTYNSRYCQEACCE